MEKQELIEKAENLANQAKELAEAVAAQSTEIVPAVAQAAEASGGTPFIYLFTAFVLACFVGYYVVWSVTPALHSPLMGVTNAISSVIIVGALIAAGPADMNLSKIFGFIAVVLASVNIFGGFVVTNRMLSMFKKKPKA
ncbi:NAD(P) transhydrogenase subunit alpha [Aestuariispira insulae]|uniref:proton-translocating NAD(P)(+) transhydrogenase n=1 Tax=Aestuariispira insulae TaxID=1461337 RepID=A0A3D9HWX8_9PROT|nr:NAD(P) transhydrogenase subunit alpha [Aestuariispira insulae]RED54012.1 pyridine nucleotide transhydrogenase-like protein [Aestuariispira insulae]